MAFRDDYREYEAWLRTQCDVVEEDLKYKRQLMKENPFVFLRATAFRWARRIGRVCPELAGAPAVLSVVDLHMENFGTWRDAEGRLIWGVNDFDEAAEAPYVFDLVRLAASARLVPGLRIARPAIAAAILDGYRRGLEAPRPTLLDEQETWMRPLVACSDRQRAKFWDEVHAYPDALPPPAVAAGLRASLPAGAVLERLASCRKGGGSLGRPRYVAIAAWRGGHVVREAKALVPSAWDWAHGDRAVAPRFAELADGAFRTPDPFLRVEDRFIYRRIAAELAQGELRRRRPRAGGAADRHGARPGRHPCRRPAFARAARRSGRAPGEMAARRRQGGRGGGGGGLQKLGVRRG